jgi:hypothetical protein
VSNVVPIGIERSRRAHPSMQPARPQPLALLERQLLASLVEAWKKSPPSDAQIDAVVAVLMGES